MAKGEFQRNPIFAFCSQRLTVSKKSKLARCLLPFLVGAYTKGHAITVTDTLPQGVRAGVFVFVGTGAIDSTLNSDGKLELLSQPLNRTLTLEDLAGFDPRLRLLKSTLDSVGPFGLSEGLLSADLKLDLSIQENRQVGALAWGVNDNWMLGLMVPGVSRSINAKFSALVQKDSSQVRAALGNAPPTLTQALNTFDETQLNEETFLKAIFDDRGYQRPKSSSRFELGDIEVESRYRYFRSPHVDLQLRTIAKLPTGRSQPDITNLFDKPVGTGAYGLKVGSFHDFRVIPKRLSINTALWGGLYTGTSEVRAVKLSPDELIPDLNNTYQVERVSKQLGPEIRWDSGVLSEFYNGAIAFSVNYVFEGKGSDRYRGSRNLDYQGLGENSWSRIHGIETQLELSSIPLFLEKKAPLPGKLTLTFFGPTGGRNYPLAPYGRVDVLLLF